MTVKIKLMLLTLTAVGAMWLVPQVKADQWDKQTVFTFKKPVQVPGRVLPAGTYLFKLADSEADRAIVQIYSDDHMELLTTVSAVRDYRAQTDNVRLSFEERSEGEPEAIHSWFYAGDNQGVRFVYPKNER